MILPLIIGFNILIAIIYAISTYGIGFGITKLLKLKNGETLILFLLRWVLGWIVLVFVINLLGMSKSLNQPIYLVLSLIGFIPLLVSWFKTSKAERHAKWLNYCRQLSKIFKHKLIPILIIIFILINLVVALAPVTKDDELNYHMPFLKSVVQNGGLVEEELPFQAFTPMAQQTWYLPVYGLNAHESPAILNLIISIFMALVAFLWLKKYTQLKYAWLGTLAVFITIGGVSLYGVPSDNVAAWFWSLATLILLYEFLYKTKNKEYSHWALLLLGLVFIAALTVKISNAPLAFFATILVLIKLIKDKRSFKYYLCLLGPMLIFYVLFLIRIYTATGNPFFPMLNNIFPPTNFDSAIYNEIAQQVWTQPENYSIWRTILEAIKHNFTYNISLVIAFLSASGAIFLLYKKKWSLFFCSAILYIAVLWLTPTSPRLLTGYLLFLALIPFIYSWKIINWKITKAIIILYSLIIIGLAGFYGVQFGKYVFGFETRDSFMTNKVQAYQDIQWINNNLPAEAKILSTIRQTYFFEHPVTEAYQFLIFEGEILETENEQEMLNYLKNHNFTHILFTPQTGEYLSLPEEFKNRLEQILETQAELIHTNEQAVIKGLRNPLREPTIGELKIYELQ